MLAKIVMPHPQGALSNAAVCPSVRLSHAYNSKRCIVGLWLVHTTNRKLIAGNRTHWNWCRPVIGVNDSTVEFTRTLKTVYEHYTWSFYINS